MNYKQEKQLLELVEKQQLVKSLDNIELLCDALEIRGYLEYHRGQRTCPKRTKHTRMSNNVYLTDRYHTADHDIRVALAAYNIGIYESLTLDELRQTVLAGLFHDFHHTQQKVPDEINIYNAVSGWTDAVEAVNEFGYKNTMFLDADYEKKVATHIRRTTYPRLDAVKRHRIAKVLCDADVIGPCFQTVEEVTNGLIGLFKEEYFPNIDEPICHLLDCISDTDKKSFIEAQQRFRTLHVWYTRRATMYGVEHNWLLKHKQATANVEKTLSQHSCLFFKKAA